MPLLLPGAFQSDPGLHLYSGTRKTYLIPGYVYLSNNHWLPLLRTRLWMPLCKTGRERGPWVSLLEARKSFYLQPPRIRQTHLWQPHPPRTLPPSHLCFLLPRSNPIFCGWTSLSSWPAMASWLVMSARSILKTTCASIVVQETTSWTSVPRSKPWSYLRAAVL